MTSTASIPPKSLTKVGDLVTKRNEGRQERIRRVLDRLGGLGRGDDDRALVEVLVNARDGLGAAFVTRSDDDTVRVQEIVKGLTLAQKLRIHGDAKIQVCALSRFGLKNGNH